MKYLLQLLIGFSGFFVVFAATSNSFNFEIARHTVTAIEGILSKVSFAVDIPTDRIQYAKELILGKLHNPSIELSFLVDDLFPLIKTFTHEIRVSGIYLAAEADGKFDMYIIDSKQSNELIVSLTDPSNYLGQSIFRNYAYNYRVDQYGYPLNFWQPLGAFHNETYDPRMRPWYTPVKANPIKQWSPLYLDATSGDPCLTIVTPLFNNTDNGNKSFIGTMALDLFLKDISEFLLHQYEGTNRIVFIIAKDSNILIGNSLSYPDYGMDSNGNKVRTVIKTAVYFVF